MPAASQRVTAETETLAPPKPRAQAAAKSERRGGDRRGPLRPEALAPVRTRFGFHIIQLDDVRSGRFPSLAEVKPRIQQQLTQIRIDELVKGLRGKAKIE